MAMINNFLKLCEPTPDLLSPHLVSVRNNSMEQLKELRVGDYIIRAEHIHGQAVDGFAAVYNLTGRLLFEGEYHRSRKNGFGV